MSERPELDRAIGAEGLFWKLWKEVTQGMTKAEELDFIERFKKLLFDEDERKSFGHFLKAKNGEV